MLIVAICHFVRPFVPLVCPEHVSKTVKGISMKLTGNRWIDLIIEVQCTRIITLCLDILGIISLCHFSYLNFVHMSFFILKVCLEHILKNNWSRKYGTSQVDSSH